MCISTFWLWSSILREWCLWFKFGFCRCPFKFPCWCQQVVTPFHFMVSLEIGTTMKGYNPGHRQLCLAVWQIDGGDGQKGILIGEILDLDSKSWKLWYWWLLMYMAFSVCFGSLCVTSTNFGTWIGSQACGVQFLCWSYDPWLREYTLDCWPTVATWEGR